MGVGNCYKCGSSEHTTKSCNNKSNDTGGWLFLAVALSWVAKSGEICYSLRCQGPCLIKVQDAQVEKNTKK